MLYGLNNIGNLSCGDLYNDSTFRDRVYHGLPETRGVSETGHAGSGTVLDFGTPRHTVYPCHGVAGIRGYISKVI